MTGKKQSGQSADYKKKSKQPAPETGPAVLGGTEMKIVLVGGGPPECLPDLSEFSRIADAWAGADRGVLVLLENGIVPDAAFGDFDSVSGPEREAIRRAMPSAEEFPAEKDETDLEIAFNWALSREPDEIWILGATGGRLDHFMGNIQLLLNERSLALSGTCGIYIADRQNILTVKAPGSYPAETKDGWPYISFIPMGQAVSGLTLHGFKYPLDSALLRTGTTLGVSNELISDNGSFSFEDGILLVVRSRE